MKRLAIGILTILCLAGSAQAAAFPLGLRAGWTVDPDQFHFGGHIQLSELFPGFRLRPGAEIGFGDDVTQLALNGDLVYRFTELETAEWGVFVGGGLGWYYTKFDLPEGYEGDDDTTDLGLTGLGGIVRKLSGGQELSLEFRLGLEDAPDFKVTVGLTFF
jgi:hypothetical protein